MEDGVKPQDTRLLRLVAWAEEAEEATQDARKLSERDRDYYDSKQWTAAEKAALEERKQPVVTFNVIKARIEYLLGLEKQQRRDPKAYYRNQPDQVAADAFTQGLRFLADSAQFHAKRTKVWRNIVVEGYGGVEVYVEPDGIDYAIRLNHIPWDRLLFDPHSSSEDFADARYVGQVMWMDLDEAIGRYGDEAREVLETAFANDNVTGTFEDKPRWSVWSDPKRKRVRIVSMWHKDGRGDWSLSEFTKAGMLYEQASPYQDKDGKSLCPLVLESAHVDRDNNRYGEARHLIDPQDEINKRRSKALHQSVSRGIIMSEGALTDVAKARKELAKPDFVLTVNEVEGEHTRFQIVDGVQMAAGQAALLQDAHNYVSQAGPNQALLGKGTESQSGRAIEAQQAGGLIEMGDLMDTLRRFDQRVFQLFAAMMQQFWTAERWIRVTDDELAPQAVGLNVVEYDEYGQPQMQNNVAEMDVDVIVSDGQHVIAMQGEAYMAFMQALPQLAALPPAFAMMAIKVNPALTSQQKREMVEALEQMSQPNPEAQAAQAAQAQKVQERSDVETEEIRSKAIMNMARADEIAARSQPVLPAYPIEPMVA